MSSGRTFIGVLFLLVGGILLLDNLGMLPFALADLVWPLVLVLVGAWFLLRSRRAPQQLDTESLQLAAEGAENAQLKLEHAAGTLRVGPGAAPEQLLRGLFQGGVNSSVTRSSNSATVELSVPSQRWMDFPLAGEGGFDWKMELSQELKYELHIKAAAGKTQLNLTDLQVVDLRMETGASLTRVLLPAVVKVGRVRLEAGAASVELQLPPGVAARIRSEAGLAKVDIPTRFEKRGGFYESVDYESAERRFEIDIQTGVGHVKVM